MYDADEPKEEGVQQGTEQGRLKRQQTTDKRGAYAHFPRRAMSPAPSIIHPSANAR